MPNQRDAVSRIQMLVALEFAVILGILENKSSILLTQIILSSLYLFHFYFGTVWCGVGQEEIGDIRTLWVLGSA